MSATVENTRPASITRLSTWSELNRQWLVAAINRLRERIDAQEAKTSSGQAPIADCVETQPVTAFTPALIYCAKVFGLSPFERELLLMMAGVELDQGLRATITGLDSSGQVLPTFGLALALLTQPHWDALSPDRPLRHWKMVEPGPGGVLAQAPLQIDERVLHFISGVAASDAHLDGLASIIRPSDQDELVDNLPLAERMAGLLAADDDRNPIVVLHGGEREAGSRRDLALATMSRLARPSLWISARDLPGDPATLSLLARHTDREYTLTDAVPIVAVEGPADEGVALGFVERLQSPVLWLGTPGYRLSALPPMRRVVRFEVPRPDARQTREMLLSRWKQLAPPDAHTDQAIAVALERSSVQFHLGRPGLEHVAERMGMTTPAERPKEIWAAAREVARGGLDALAQRIDTNVTFADLVLPTGQSAALRDIARQLRHRDRVYREWEFGKKHQLGQGLVALFAGESGTGKTLAAEAIANEVELDLYRVDLATLVSKYIGETEKNLKRLFEAAEASGAVMLFDEADALFGKRSEVKDSHDRYANIEVAYLLQRIETYRGLAVLTTNMKSALDRAFLRRIRFVITFPFPDATAREQIWRRQFPAAAPMGEIDFAALSRLNLAGGHIRSIVLNAAFKAADRGGAIDQDVLAAAAREEFAKLERSMGDALKGASR